MFFNLVDLTIDEPTLKGLCLMEIEKIVLVQGKSLKDFRGMPCVDPSILKEYGNILLYNELNFDVAEMRRLHEEHLGNLNTGQKRIYDKIMSAVTSKDGEFFFVYGYGGTRKTLLWKTLTYGLWFEKRVVL